MAKKWKAYNEHEAIHNGTSLGRNPKTSSMNKSQKRDFKKYRGQGKRRWPQLKVLKNFVKSLKKEKKVLNNLNKISNKINKERNN